MLNRTHLLIAFIANLAALVVLVIVPGQGDLGGNVGLVDALSGLELILGGAIAGAQVPSPGA